MKLFENLCYDWGKILRQLPLVTTALLYNCDFSVSVFKQAIADFQKQHLFFKA